MTDLFLGIDLGGTFVKLGVCTRKGEIQGTISIPTRPDLGPQNTIGEHPRGTGAYFEGVGSSYVSLTPAFCRPRSRGE